MAGTFRSFVVDQPTMLASSDLQLVCYCHPNTTEYGHTVYNNWLESMGVPGSIDSLNKSCDKCTFRVRGTLPGTELLSRARQLRITDKYRNRHHELNGINALYSRLYCCCEKKKRWRAAGIYTRKIFREYLPCISQPIAKTRFWFSSLQRFLRGHLFFFFPAGIGNH